MHIEEFIEQARSASANPSPSATIKGLLQRLVNEPEHCAAAIEHRRGANADENELWLHEDENISIVYVRLMPGVLGAPHDHQMPVFIGVYRGTEINRFYRASSGHLTEINRRTVTAGDVLSFGPDGIHTVQTENATPSEAIHVYLGALSNAQRSLFDWETGQAFPYSGERYGQMERKIPIEDEGQVSSLSSL